MLEEVMAVIGFADQTNRFVDGRVRTDPELDA